MTGTELVRYEEKTAIDLAPEAWGLSQRIARTEFVPTALRNKPESVLACILTGHELGIGAMQALSKIHVIEGKPSMAAELMRAVILREGHVLDIEESTNTRCTIVARRSNSERETRMTYSIDDAKRAGLEGKQNWRKYPRAMLLARCTSEIARAVFPDVLAGISYSLEELTDGDVIDPDDVEPGDAPTPAPAGAPVVKKAAAKKAATRKAAAPRAASPAPALPGEEEFEPAPAAAEDDDDEEVAVVIGPDGQPIGDEPLEETPYEGPDQDLTPPTRAPLSGPAVIAIKLEEHGIKDRDVRLAVVGGIVGREIASSKDLVPVEVRLVLDTINEEGWTPDLEALGSVPFEAEEPGADPEPAEALAPSPGDGDSSRSSVSPEPEAWDGPKWRAFLTERGVKVTELLKEASKLAHEQETRPPGTLDDLAGSGIADLLVGFVEDLAQSRGMQ